MELSTKVISSIVFCYLLLVSQVAFCQVRLPRLVSDGMVLQRDANVNIWGWADKGERVTVKFNGRTYKAITCSDGTWLVVLPKLKAGGPYTMQIKGEDNNITLKDILVGDVWVCSGQSNMDLNMYRARDVYPDVIANSENPHIRRFFVSTKYDFKKPLEDLDSGTWDSANPESVLKFTATGYFFAKALYEKYKVPIGLIHASLGGSPIQAWMSEGALKEFPKELVVAEKYKDGDYIKQVEEKDKVASDAWYNTVRQNDKGLAEGEKPWFDPAYDTSEWQTMNIPGMLSNDESGPVTGVVWFRKEIDVPASMLGKPARLWLGRIVDSDEAYVNGSFVGSVSYQYPPRKYDIPANLLKEGKNIIVVRVTINGGWGGFIVDKPYRLMTAEQTLDLRGPWQYKVGMTMDTPAPSSTFVRWKPTGLYNGMIAPVLNYTIKGVIWYQGESNTGNPSEYSKLFPIMIADWREKWEQGDFPFLYVQLPNIMPPQDQPSESNWAELREVQLKTLDVVPNTGMAVTIDVGEWNDPHPLNKKDVGERLALAARKVAYGDRRVVYSGPVYKSMEIEGNKIILSFTNIGGGLVAKGDGELKHFAIAGADKKFVWANAKIEGNKVVVYNDDIAEPMFVRYGWASNPEGANLYNKEGLPASPFTTED